MSVISKRASTEPKIDSPMAKYTTKGDLMCSLCGKVIKPASQKLWTAHLVSVKHKESVAMLKQSISSKQPSDATTVSQPQKPRGEQEVVQPVITLPSAPAKGILKRRPSEQPVIFVPPPNPVLQPRNSGVQPSSDLGTDSNHKPAKQVKVEDPADRNGSEEVESTANEKQMEVEDGKCLPEVASEIPAGFFDDPKMDARARNVDFVDPLEKEFQEFQKIIQQEEKAAETMEQEETALTLHEREIERIEGQMSYFARAAQLFEQKRVQEGKHHNIPPTDTKGHIDPSSMDTKEVIAHFLNIQSGNEEDDEKNEDQRKNDVLGRLTGKIMDAANFADNIYGRKIVRDEPSDSEIDSDEDFSEFDMTNWRKKSILK